MENDNVLGNVTEEIKQEHVEATKEAEVKHEEAVAREHEAVEKEVGEKGTFLDLLSEDIRGESNLKDFKDVNSLAKSYLNAQKLIGKSLRIPGEDSSKEAREEFFAKLNELDDVIVRPNPEDKEGLDKYLQKLGRPEKADDYVFDKVLEGHEDFINKVPSFQEELSQVKDVAFELGLNNEQTQRYVQERINTLKGMAEHQEQLVADRSKELRNMWGADFDNRIHAVNELLSTYEKKYPEYIAEFKTGNGVNNPVILDMLSQLARDFKEKGHHGMQSTKIGMSANEAKAKIEAKKLDKGFMKALHDALDPGHAKAMKELDDLYDTAYPKE